MIIDAHAHVRLDSDASGQETEKLLAAMDAAGIDKAAVFAATISGLTAERVLAETEPHRDRLFVVGAISPSKDGFRTPPAQVDDWLADGRVRALKFYTGYEHFFPNDERLRPYMDLLVKHGRPAIFHMGDLYDKIRGAKLKYAHPLGVDDLASEMPDLKIIIAHLGSPWVLDAAEVCYKNPNVYADCSGYVYGTFTEGQAERFRDAWRAFDEITEGQASRKILYGSDWPICDMRSYLDVVGSCVKDAEGLDRVLSGNARALFGV